MVSRQERGKGNLEVDGGRRIRWNDRNHCCQGFLKIRLQRVDGVGVGGADIETSLGRRGSGKEGTRGKREIARGGKSNMQEVEGGV